MKQKTAYIVGVCAKSINILSFEGISVDFIVVFTSCGLRRISVKKHTAYETPCEYNGKLTAYVHMRNESPQIYH